MKQEICKDCGKPIVKHIRKEGARFHVHSYYRGKNGACVHCSEPACEDNHGEGHCIPYSEETLARMRKMEHTGEDFQRDYMR